MHNQQVSTSASNNNMIPTLDVKSSTKFQAPNILPKENTIEVCDVQRHKMIFMLPFFKCTFLLVTCLLIIVQNLSLSYFTNFLYLGYDSREERI